MKRALVVVAFTALASPASAQNFSCNYGKRGACLDYGDQICSSQGKCVNQNAACFDSYQCNYEGFTCKSNVTACFEQHDALVREYNDLLSSRQALGNEYDALVSKYNDLLSDHRDLISEYDDLLIKAKNMANSYDELRSCLDYADDLDQAKNCGY